MSDKITALGINFNAADVAPSEAMEALPAAWYPVAITDGEVKVNDGGNGRRLAITWTVLEGQYKGRKVFDGFNFIHSNPQAQEIGQRDLSAICHATGVLNISDISQLFNKAHQIKVDVEAARHVDADGNTVEQPVPNGKTYAAKNRFKGAKAYTATGATTAAPAAAAPKAATPPWAAATPAAAPAPAAAPVATEAPAASAVPEKRKPGRPPKAPVAAAPAPAPKVERKFWVGLDGFDTMIPESEVVANFQKGMPLDTPLMVEGETDWKDAAAYGVAVPGVPAATPAPAPAPVAPAAPAKPAAAAAPAAKLPPWAVK